MSSHRCATPGIHWWVSAALVFASISAGCDGRQTPGKAVPLKPDSVISLSQPAAKETEPAALGEHGPFRFVDICSTSGVDFVHASGMTADKLFPTANGSGVAVFDYDGDGKLDLYFATGNTLPLSAAPSASNRLYRNLGGGKFHEETQRCGLAFRGYCHGITVGDVNNDGAPTCS